MGRTCADEDDRNAGDSGRIGTSLAVTGVTAPEVEGEDGTGTWIGKTEGRMKHVEQVRPISLPRKTASLPSHERTRAPNALTCLLQYKSAHETNIQRPLSPSNEVIVDRIVVAVDSSVEESSSLHDAGEARCCALTGGS